jgi:hypothetical protein
LTTPDVGGLRALLTVPLRLHLPQSQVVVQFEKFPRDCHSEARHYRARNLLFRRRQPADSSPIKQASECQGVGLFSAQNPPRPKAEVVQSENPQGIVIPKRGMIAR